jgi:hypothetical protein
MISSKAAKPPGTANCGGCLKRAFKQDSDADPVIDSRQWRFASLLGLLRNIRLAFDSARFAISALIFSIRVLISGAATLRVEFMAFPSSRLLGNRLIQFRQQAIKQSAVAGHASTGRRGGDGLATVSGNQD